MKSISITITTLYNLDLNSTSQMSKEQFFTRFHIEKQIGEGGNSTVHLASDTKLNKQVAIKISKTEDVVDMLEEVEILSRLNHKNIMKCYEKLEFIETDPETHEVIMGTDDKPLKRVYLVLELIKGSTLDKFVANQLQWAKSPDDILVEHIQRIENEVAEILKDQLRAPDVRYYYHQLVRQLIPKDIKETASLNSKQLQGDYDTAVDDSSTIDDYQSFNSSNIKIKSQKQVTVVQKPKTKSVVSYLESVKKLFLQLLDVLIYMDKNQIIHRDLKPDNLMVTNTLELKIIDFGSGKRMKKYTQQEQFVGTYGYMAPEIFLAKKKSELNYTVKVDTWAAGGILFFMLFGYPPYLQIRQQSIQELQNTYGMYLPTDIRGADYVDKAFVDVIEQAFTLNIQARADAQQLKNLFMRCVAPRTQAEFRRTIPIKCLKVVLIGEFGCGKTTLLRRMAQCTKDQRVSVVHRIATINNEQVQLEFHDTVGCEFEGGIIMPSILQHADLLFLVYKAGNAESFQKLDGFREQAARQNSKAITKLIANKFTADARDQFVIEGVRKYEFCFEDPKVEQVLISCTRECIQEDCFEVKVPVMGSSLVARGIQQEKAKSGCC